MFDYKNFSKILKSKRITSTMLSQRLEQKGILITKDGIDGYRKGAIKNPKNAILEAISNICEVSIIEFFSDFDKRKEQITLQEISDKPDKYSKSISNAFLSTMPNGIDKFIENYLLLTKEQQEDLLHEMKKMAQENMKF